MLQTAANVALARMMLLTTADEVRRHVLGRPMPGTVEPAQSAIVVVLAGLPVMVRDRRHISLGLLESRFGRGRSTFNQRSQPAF